MNFSPKITILLATYNRAHLIGETLDSILAQTFSNWECIIVDDFSVDDTFAVVNKYIQMDSRFTYYQKPTDYNKGLSASRNYGLELAKSLKPDFIQFFDDDDVMHSRKLELQVRNLEQNLNSQFCLCGTKNFKISSEVEETERKNPIGLGKFSIGEAYLTGRINFVAQVPLFRYDFCKTFKFDEDLFYAEEWTLFSMQFLLKKPEFTTLHEVLFYRRKHPISITERDDVDFSRRKTSAITGIKIFNFLEENKLHTKVTILYFLRQFLLYNYKSDVLTSIRRIIKEYYPILMFRYKLARSCHWVLRKFILRILKF